MKSLINIFEMQVTNRYDGADATIEILILMLGAALLGFAIGFFVRRPKKEYIFDYNQEEINFANSIIDENDTKAKLIIENNKKETKSNVEVANKVADNIAEIDLKSDNISAKNNHELSTAEEIKEESISKSIEENVEISDNKENEKLEVEEVKLHKNISVEKPEINIEPNKIESKIDNENLKSSSETKDVRKSRKPKIDVIEKTEDNTIENNKIEKVKELRKVEKSKKAAKTEKTPSKIDDLKIIEGIGPAIAKHLNENGIVSFEQLSETSVDKIQEILDLSGARFSIHSPATWPMQASVYLSGDQEAFKKLKEELKGGRFIK